MVWKAHSTPRDSLAAIAHGSKQESTVVSHQLGRPHNGEGQKPVRRGAGCKKEPLPTHLAFSGEVRAELAKVDYLNRQQTIQATLVVLGACFLVGLYLYGLDQLFARLATRLIDFQN